MNDGSPMTSGDTSTASMDGATTSEGEVTAAVAGPAVSIKTPTVGVDPATASGEGATISCAPSASICQTLRASAAPADGCDRTRPEPTPFRRRKRKIAFLHRMPRKISRQPRTRPLTTKSL